MVRLGPGVRLAAVSSSPRVGFGHLFTLSAPQFIHIVDIADVVIIELASLVIQYLLRA